MSQPSPQTQTSTGALLAQTHNALAMLDLALEDMPVEEAPSEQPGDEIGSYTLVKKLGEGGFGIVWQADQSKPIRRTVALKVIRPGMDSLAVLSRFRAERRALERMSHPNIAVVLDAGSTPLGRPFFVLELVNGRPITSFCEEAGLDVRQRLLLFLDVCRAVQHAHQKAVLHRDLKPSNILVAAGDTGPVPKVIDFGISKALTEDATGPDSIAFTMRGVVLGTPEYMAPEQAALGAEVVDVRVDVYSLGAILYEMLTGVPPLASDSATPRKTTITAMLQRIYEVEPERPSTRARQRLAAGKHSPARPEQLGGDLDWILLKALEKNADRRYDSVDSLADDISRHLADEPVSAAAPGRWYRLQKLVKRNRVAFAIGTVVTLNLLLLTAISTFAFLQEAEARENADRMRNLAEVQSRKAQALNLFLTQLLTQAGEFVKAGKNPEALRLAVNESVGQVASLEAEPEIQMELLDRLISIFFAMGDFRSALPLCRQMYDQAVNIYGESSPRTLKIRLLMTRAISDTGDKPLALKNYAELDRLWKELGTKHEDERFEMAQYYARELARQNRASEGLAMVKTRLDEMAAHPQKQSSNLLFLADLQLGAGEYDAAEKTIQQILEVHKAHKFSLNGRSIVYRTYSRVKAKQKDFVTAAKHLEECIRLESASKGAESYALVGRWIEVARHYMKTGRSQDAFRATDEAIAIARAHGNDQLLPRGLRGAAEIREESGNLQAALAFRRECMGLERLYNTDRGKWIYELSEIVRLEAELGLFDDLKRDAAELWKHADSEPAVTTDPPFRRSICHILIKACEKWQSATGKKDFGDAILAWKTITAEGMVQK